MRRGISLGCSGTKNVLFRPLSCHAIVRGFITQSLYRGHNRKYAAPTFRVFVLGTHRTLQSITLGVIVDVAMVILACSFFDADDHRRILGNLITPMSRELDLTVMSDCGLWRSKALKESVRHVRYSPSLCSHSLISNIVVATSHQRPENTIGAFAFIELSIAPFMILKPTQRSTICQRPQTYGSSAALSVSVL